MIPVLLGVAGLALGGCVQVDVPERIEFDAGGNDGDRSQIPSSGGGGLEGLAYGIGSHLVGAEGDCLFYGFDTLAYPDSEIELAAGVRDVQSQLDGASGVTVGFYRGETLIGRSVTDRNGIATVRWTPPRVGDYTFQARILRAPERLGEDFRRASPAPLIVSARRKSEKFAVIDLDHTVVASSFWRVLLGGAKPMAESVRVTRRIARRHSLIYLTHRPDLLTRKSRRWLNEQGFPTGVLMVSSLSQAIGDSGVYKTARLSKVRKRFPNVEIGIGDKYSDAQAYVDNGMTAFLIPNYDRGDVEELRAAARSIRRLEGKGRLHVVQGWEEIEDVIFGNKRFPPGRMVSYLEGRASRLAAREREEDDDDDDDDEEDDEDDD
jgi:hypothetical protein